MNDSFRRRSGNGGRGQTPDKEGRKSRPSTPSSPTRDSPRSGVSIKAETVESTVAIIAISIIVAHFLASFSFSNWTWGFHHFYFLNPVVRWLLTTAGVILCIPSVARSLIGRVRTVAHGIHRPLGRQNRRIWYGLVSLSSFLPFWLLRTKTHFLGDGYLRLRGLEDQLPVSSRGFLDSSINAAVFRNLGERLGWDPETAAALISCCCGVLFVFAVFLIGEITTKDRLKRSIVWGLLLSMGTVQLCFGYVEVYPILLVAILYYLIASLLYLRGKVSLIVPAILLFVAILIHISALCLFPSLVFLSFLMGWNTARRKSLMGATKRALIGTMGLVVAFGLLCILFLSGDMTLETLQRWGPLSIPFRLLQFLLDNMLPFRESAVEPGGYPLLSLVHLANLVNEQLLIGPMGFAICLAMFALGGLKIMLNDVRGTFLGIATLFYLLPSLVFRPNIGAGRDWDIFSMGGVLFTLMAAYLLVTLGFNRKTLRYVGTALVIVSLLHTAPWIYINASEEKGLRRFRLMLHSDPQWTDYARGYGHETLGSYFYATGDFDQVARECETAFNLSNNPRVLSNMGIAYLEQGLFDKSMAAFKKTIELHPKSHVAWAAYSNLGVIYLRMGLHDKAIIEFRRALELDPKNAKLLCNLGIALEKVELYDEAIQVLKRATELNPECAQAYTIRGAIYLRMGLHDKAIAAFERVLELDPKNAKLLCNLGEALGEKKLYDEAIQAFKRATELDTTYARAYFSLGDILLKKILHDNVNEKREMCDEAIDSYHKFIKYWTGTPDYTKKAEYDIKKIYKIIESER